MKARKTTQFSLKDVRCWIIEFYSAEDALEFLEDACELMSTLPLKMRVEHFSEDEKWEPLRIAYRPDPSLEKGCPARLLVDQMMMPVGFVYYELGQRSYEPVVVDLVGNVAHPLSP